MASGGDSKESATENNYLSKIGKGEKVRQELTAKSEIILVNANPT